MHDSSSHPKTTTWHRTQEHPVRPDGGGSELREDETVVLETSPKVKPLVIRLAGTLLIGLLAIAGLYIQPELLGSPETTNLGLLVVQILLVIAVVHLLVKIVVLWNTSYIVTDRMVRRHYSLLGRSVNREVPYDLVRSTERSQGRIESLLDLGSISLNRGLGNLRLSYVGEHRQVYDVIRRLVEQR